MAEDHQDACEAALLMAMIFAKSQAKALDADEIAATEDFGHVKKAKGDKGAGEGNNKRNKTGLGEEKNGGDSQVKGLDTSSSKGKNGEGKTGTTRMVVKENDWGAVFSLLIIACFLYKIFF